MQFCQKLDEQNAAYLTTSKEEQDVFQTSVATLYNGNNSPQENVPSLGEIKKFQRLDEDLSTILSWIEGNDGRPNWSVVALCSRIIKILWAQWDSL